MDIVLVISLVILGILVFGIFICLLELRTQKIICDAKVKAEGIRCNANIEIAEKLKEKVNLNLNTEDIAKIFNK